MSKIKSLILIVISVLSIILLVTFIIPKQGSYIPKNELEDKDIIDSKEILSTSLNQSKLYLDFLEENKGNLVYNEKLDTTKTNIITKNDDNSIGKNDFIEYEVSISEAGLYNLEYQYRVASRSLENATLSILIDNKHQYEEQKTIDLPLKWIDETKEFSIDRYGDEVLSNQYIDQSTLTTKLYNNTYTTTDALLFKFEEGINTIKVENVSATKVFLEKLTVVSQEKDIGYKDYHIKNNQYNIIDEIIEIDSREYSSKNSSYIHLESLNDPSVYPFNATYKKLNVISGNSWDEAGQEIEYIFDVSKEGLYEISLHYLNTKDDFSVFRSIYINNEIPFKELKAYEFKSLDKNNWQNEVLRNNEENFKIHLKAGKNSLKLKAEVDPLSESLKTLQLVIDHINKFALDIRKEAGRVVDKDRTWRFTENIPETPEYLKAYEVLLKSIITDLSNYAIKGHNSATLSYLQKALNKLAIISKDPDVIPLYLDDLSGGTGSMAQYLGDSLSRINQQPLSLNAMYVSNNNSLPKANAGFFTKLKSQFTAFISSFTSDKYKMTTSDDDVVEVWVNRPITYVDMMQKMADQLFTPKTGIEVKLSVMQDANKIIMASAADQQPDVALGLASHIPYDLAIRNAAYDLTSFPDYWNFVSDFAPGAHIPYILNDRAYAISETLDFNVLMYRKDIFDSLSIPIPNSWQDVIDILPELQKYGMNFYHPIAGGDSIKWFYQTSGFIYQFGGSLYDETGMKTTIGEDKAVQGMTFLNNLFINYSMPEQVPSFYNSFRYATLPIGIADFQTYLLIKNAAPELSGQWEIAPYPSIEVNGEENRYYIANGSSALIMESTKLANESWKFLKWWMSEDTQIDFAFNLESTYGPTFAWLSANLKAFRNSPFPEDHREIIEEQFKWLIDVPRTPGQYMVERSLSDIWNSAVFNGLPTGNAIDQYTIQMDREIRRKMIEFGYLDNDGNIIKEYQLRDIEWIKERMGLKKND